MPETSPTLQQEFEQVFRIGETETSFALWLRQVYGVQEALLTHENLPTTRSNWDRQSRPPAISLEASIPSGKNSYYIHLIRFPSSDPIIIEVDPQSSANTLRQVIFQALPLEPLRPPSSDHTLKP